MDLGTANTLVYVRGEGVVLDQPSIVKKNTLDGTVLAVGADARRMIGRTPGHIQAIRPLEDGVIADFDVCEKMLRYFVQQIHSRRWAKPRMVICVPSGVTGVERRAVQEAAEQAGARSPAYIIEEPIAAAIGSGLPIAEPTGNMIVDIGGGTTEVAVISLGGVVASQSVRIGGNELDEASVQYLKQTHGAAVGVRMAEKIKIELGSAYPLEQEVRAEVNASDLVTGMPRRAVFSTGEIREAIEAPVAVIIDAVKNTLDRTPPELGADIMERGIVLAGGGALLMGLRERLSDETGMDVANRAAALEYIQWEVSKLILRPPGDWPGQISRSRYKSSRDFNLAIRKLMREEAGGAEGEFAYPNSETWVAGPDADDEYKVEFSMRLTESDPDEVVDNAHTIIVETDDEDILRAIFLKAFAQALNCLLYTSPSPRD